MPKKNMDSEHQCVVTIPPSPPPSPSPSPSPLPAPLPAPLSGSVANPHPTDSCVIHMPSFTPFPCPSSDTLGNLYTNTKRVCGIVKDVFIHDLPPMLAGTILSYTCSEKTRDWWSFISGLVTPATAGDALIEALVYYTGECDKEISWPGYTQLLVTLGVIVALCKYNQNKYNQAAVYLAGLKETALQFVPSTYLPDYVKCSAAQERIFKMGRSSFNWLLNILTNTASFVVLVTNEVCDAKEDNSSALVATKTLAGLVGVTLQAWLLWCQHTNTAPETETKRYLASFLYSIPNMAAYLPGVLSILMGAYQGLVTASPWQIVGVFLLAAIGILGNTIMYANILRHDHDQAEPQTATAGETTPLLLTRQPQAIASRMSAYLQNIGLSPEAIEILLMTSSVAIKSIATWVSLQNKLEKWGMPAGAVIFLNTILIGVFYGPTNFARAMMAHDVGKQKPDTVANLSIVSS